MGVKDVFQGGPIVHFSRLWPKAFFRGMNSGETTAYLKYLQYAVVKLHFTIS